MSGDQLDLDAIEARWHAPILPRWVDERPTALALVAEVRRLRENEARVLRWVETWEKEAAERGPGDRVYTAGVAAHLRLSIRQPEPLP